MLDQRALDCNALDPVVLSKVFERGIVRGVDLLIIWQLAYGRFIVVVIVDFPYVKCNTAKFDVAVRDLDVKRVKLVEILLEPNYQIFS